MQEQTISLQSHILGRSAAAEHQDQLVEPLRLLSVDETAARLGIGRRSLYENWLRTGKLRSFLIGGQRRIASDDFTRFVDELRQQPAPPRPSPAIRR
jgi:excisionase family DNA binding protein